MGKWKHIIRLQHTHNRIRAEGAREIHRILTRRRTSAEQDNWTQDQKRAHSKIIRKENTENKNRERRKIQPTFKGSIHPKEKEYKNKIQQRGEISHLTRKWISETLGQDSENYKKRPSKT